MKKEYEEPTIENDMNNVTIANLNIEYNRKTDFNSTYLPIALQHQ
ncbi:hypothetical protein [Clostridium tagluense]|nr:hypothetical protein [Clostridium tagluense]